MINGIEENGFNDSAFHDFVRHHFVYNYFVIFTARSAILRIIDRNTNACAG